MLLFRSQIIFKSTLSKLNLVFLNKIYLTFTKALKVNNKKKITVIWLPCDYIENILLVLTA